MITVKDIMTANPVTVHPETSLEYAAKTMKEVNCRQLPVLECGQLVGIITERDIRLAVAVPHEDMDFTHHKELSNFEVGEFMTANPKTVAPTVAVADAAELLRRMKIGALPVVEQEQLVGIITVSDCLACLSDQLEEIPTLLLA
ncbi:MAG: CBS domain-containing protein [Caldilineaceae bacterium]|nr:CBS domain-containing protein [Caldilineaceae bacterium]